LVLDQAEQVTADDMGIAAVNAVWVVNANERRNSATAVSIPGGATNVIRLTNFDINAAMIGFAHSGGVVCALDGWNFEQGFRGKYMWLTGVDYLRVTAAEGEGASDCVYVGGAAPFTGRTIGPSISLLFDGCELAPQGPSTTTVLSGGTAPPAVTLTGNPVTSRNELAFVLEVTTGGTLASTNVRFKWSADGGATFTTGVTASSAVALGSTGVTAHFAAGTYSTDNVYLSLGTQGSCFEASNQAGFPSATQLTVTHSQLSNQNATYGFVFAGYLNGITLEDNIYGNQLTFLDNTAPNLFGFGTGNGTVRWKNSNSAGANGCAGESINCVPVINGLDVNASFAMRATPVTTFIKDSLGKNNNVTNPGISAIEVSNVGGPFTLTGIAGGTEGQILEVMNLTRVDAGGPFQMTIANESSSSLQVNRIICPDAVDLIFSAPSSSSGFDFVRLKYLSSQSRWAVVGGSW
jgi:hypothetical protein